MKVLVVVATLALTSVGCLVPSLTALDTRLAGVGIEPTPYKWSIEAQIRVADERKANDDAKKGIAKRTIVWASSTSGATSKVPTLGEVTRTSASVRVPIEHTFVVGNSASADLSATLAAAMKAFGNANDKNDNTLALYLHSIDCSQRTRVGWTGMACDVEVGPEGRTLLSLSQGKVERGALKGAVTNHDASAASGKMKFTLLCDSEDEDDVDGKSEANSFALVIGAPSTIPSEHKDTHDRIVEFVLRFTRSKENALSDNEAGAPTTVVGADGTKVFLLRGNSILSRWVLPFAYGGLLLVAIRYLAVHVTKALQPKPQVNINTGSSVSTTKKK